MVKGGSTQQVEPGTGCPASLLYVPSGYQPGRAAPLLALLHGAGGGAQGTGAIPAAALLCGWLFRRCALADSKVG